ncbi:hypothetical protein HYH03_000773 [Edaphochlamys debaryana]|uniref:SRCR domain-containing protein n=1 Tax=Edaphochlamys debaryana TaxID=47281 RepID=A0A836C6H9_9CHLO|nr:hypothetical protein HYH03_000773 [Edaphochlamys debaryana]|eukprot:KAG2500949.1 hypothetical protein HYH03_000773 [Edaphochlamys debaryana]
MGGPTRWQLAKLFTLALMVGLASAQRRYTVPDAPEPPDDLAPPDSAYPPDGGFPPPADYSDPEYRPARPPRRPPPPLPPPKPRSPPVPPSPPPRPPSPPPPVPLTLRLALGTETRGIVQVREPATGRWAAVCSRNLTLRDMASADARATQAVAQLVCAELGLPALGARLVLPYQDPILKDQNLKAEPAKAAFRDFFPTCANALDVASLSACSGLVVAKGLWGSCQELAARQRLPGVYVPLAVTCEDPAPFAPPNPSQPSLPPPRPNAPPSPPPLPLPIRIVDPTTGELQDGLSSGRLELQWGGRWGTVCFWNKGAFDRALAQYACRYSGLPWEGARYRQMSAEQRTERAAERQQPATALVAQGCSLGDGEGRDATVRCNLLLGSDMTPQVFQPGGPLPEALRLLLLDVATRCNPATGGHRYDALVECRGPQPPPAPAPPLSPVPVRNSIRLNWTEHFPNVYEVRFGVPDDAGQVVWGTACSPPGEYDVTYPDVASTLCSQITGGRHSGGFPVPLDPDLSYSFLPPPEIRRDAPVVLTGLSCAHPGLAEQGVWWLDNVSGCEYEAADPLPSSQLPHCDSSGWCANLLACGDMLVDPRDDTSYIVSLRLTGGATPRSGRLEVVMRHEVSYGWGAVCDDGTFTREHAQAACRDMGLPWQLANLLPTSAAAPPPEGMHVLLSDVDCDSPYAATPTNLTAPRVLSLMRDCTRSRPYAYSPCRADQQAVVIHCTDGSPEAPLEPPPPQEPPPVPSMPPPPAYGAYGTYPPGAYGTPGSVPTYLGEPSPAAGPAHRRRLRSL